MPGARIPFARMNGIGNTIIIADSRGSARPVSERAALRLASDTVMHFDQIMEVADPAGPGRDYDIRILNSDGSTAQACGNGTRCVVAWLHERDNRTDYRFHTDGGQIAAVIGEGGRIAVDMGPPRFGWQDIPLAEEFGDTTGIELQIGPIDAPVLHTPSVVSMGNPHAVFWVDDVLTHDLERFGPLLENHPIFPERANITLAHVIASDHVEIRTWERGAGLTMACGTAACAALVCAARKGLANRAATVTLPGGDLVIEWRKDDRVTMSGPVEFEFSGQLDPETGTYERDTQTERA